MKNFHDLKLGYVDAENYLKRENKALFNKFFYRDNRLDEILLPSTYFIIGEKGTGKTAYAVFLSNNEYKETRSVLKYIRETDYIKFLEMKNNKMLSFSDYSYVWKVILCLLILKTVKREDLDINIFSRMLMFRHLNSLIDDFYENAFHPEIMQAIDIVEEEHFAAAMSGDIGSVEAGVNNQQTTSKKSFKFYLMKIFGNFEKAINEIKLKKNIVMFIDGIDIRPYDISYKDYLECVKGLINAVWSVNNDLFGNVRDSKGRIKVVLLLRPDIFNSSGLQNAGNKLADNSVVLDWQTKYPIYRDSHIFKMIDRLLAVQQEQVYPEGTSWDYYFPWKKRSTNTKREFDDSFISFLRISYCRPRDIIQALQILQKNFSDRDPKYEKFIESNEFLADYSQRLLNSIKDQTLFYYSENDYEAFIHFFDFITAVEFSWDVYIDAYNKYIDSLCDRYSDIPEFVESKEVFIQFLYETNILSYVEYTDLEVFYRWCYRERKKSLSPKVKLGATYRIHYGLWKALNVGRQKIIR